jgi:hypothetical protein
MGAIARIVALVAGSPIEAAREAYAAAGTDLREAEDAFSADPSDPAYKRVVGARERADKARLLLAAAERRDTERRAAEAAAHRAKLAAEYDRLVASIDRRALLRDADPLVERLVGLVSEARAIAADLETAEADARQRHDRIREIALEIGAEVPELADTVHTLGVQVHGEATERARAELRGADGPADRFARRVWGAL